MAVTNATLASAMAASDTVAVLSASTGVSAGCKMEIDGEELLVAGNYTTAGNGVNVPVIRGQGGTYAYAHPTSAKVRVGLASDSEWGTPAPGTVTSYPTAGRARTFKSYSASGAIDLPTPGNDAVAYINGTSTLALTVASPVSAQDGCILWIIGNGKSQSTVTVSTTSGIGNASTGYTVLTGPAGGQVGACLMAANGFWVLLSAVTGTATAVEFAIS